jgi:hypothetical protein
MKRGLRQGDLISPLIFIVVTDILQQTIRSFGQQGFLQHPILQNQPCPVLQYADDTLIIVKGGESQAKWLKEILTAFEVTTGLSINFLKSTFVPIAMDDSESQIIMSILNCPVASFPQTYLGLPLSDSSIQRSIQSKILNVIDSRIDTFMIGTTSGGRLTLTNSVLSALPVHMMSCFKLPKWLIQEIDKRRRAFFWKGQKEEELGKILLLQIMKEG